MPTLNINSLSNAIHLIAPTYGPVVNGRGTGMQVLLGPFAGLMMTGTQTNSASISNVMQHFHTRDPGKWVAAHLLNAELGGPGWDPRNLVPMTATANKNHSALELKVKNLCTVVRQQMQQGNATGFCYAVAYQVVASNITFGNFSPYNMAPSHFTVSVAVHKRPWNPMAGFGGNWTPVNNFDPLLPYFQQYLFNPKDVDNDDKHL
jgi:hypothetical protein